MHFDGLTNRRHAVALRFGATLDIAEDGIDIASWPYDDLRMVDGGPGTLRLKSGSALPLARLEVFDPAAQRQITEHARFLKGEGGGPAHTGRIVAWSLAAVADLRGRSLRHAAGRRPIDAADPALSIAIWAP